MNVHPAFALEVGDLGECGGGVDGELNAGAVAPGRFDIVARRGFGHQDQRPQSQGARHIRYGLRMIASAHGDNSAASLLRREGQGLIEGAADLERTGFLEQLQLDVDVGFQALTEGRARRQRGAAHARRNALARDLNEGEGQGV